MKWYKLWTKKESRIYIFKSWLMPKFLMSGFTPGPFTMVREGCENDYPFIKHEKRHQYHWDIDRFDYWRKYLTDRLERQEYEVDAYAHQASCYHPHLVEQKICIFADYLVNNYMLNLDIIVAENLIRDRYKEIIKNELERCI